MKLSFVAACLAVSAKAISGAVMELEGALPARDNFWAFSESQTLAEFIKTVEFKVESDCPDLKANISGVDQLAPEKRVWYVAKYYDTDWKADDTSI